MMSKRKLNSLSLDPEILAKCKSGGMESVKDLFSHSLLNLMINLNLGYSELQNLLKISTKPHVEPVNAYELFKSQENNYIPLGNLHLDQILKGGIRKGTLTEFTGPPGVGKTQMCLNLSLSCLSRLKTAANVCIIDTEYTFKTERFLEMMQFKCDSVDGAEDLLKRVFLRQPQTIESFSQLLDSLELYCIENDIGLVIVDSIASLARKEFSSDTDSGLQRSVLLGSWASRLKAIADHLNLAVVVTNQVTTRLISMNNEMSSGASENTEKDVADYAINPALGGTWTHFLNTRFVLQFIDGETRQLIIAKSPDSPVAVMNYKIAPEGVSFGGNLNLTLDGMNLASHRIKARPGIKIN